MWLGIILPLVFGSLASLIVYFCIYPESDFGVNKLDKDEYRHKVRKETYDRMGCCGLGGYFHKSMDEKGEKEYAEYCEKIDKKLQKRKKFFYVLPALIVALLACFFGWLGANIKNNYLRKEIASFESSKMTYEISLKDENLTGLERIEIVNKIAEKNEWLAGKQVEVQMWYNFYLKKDILEVEPIKVTID